MIELKSVKDFANMRHGLAIDQIKLDRDWKLAALITLMLQTLGSQPEIDRSPILASSRASCE